MSRFLLCSGPVAACPFYLEEAGLRIHTAEELSYYIDENILLIEQDFFSDPLLQFIRDELRLPALAEKLKNMRETDPIEQQLFVYLKEVGYHTDAELEAFLRATEKKKAARPWETLRSKADYMVERRHFEGAIRIYDQILEDADKLHLPDGAVADLWRNKGAALCRNFCFIEAADCLEKAYSMTGDEEILKMLYGLKILEPGAGILPELFTAIDPKQQFAWKEEFELLKNEVYFSGKAAQADAVFMKDGVKRPGAVRELLGTWKRECKEMA